MAANIKIKAPLHSLLGGFQPKPYHNVSEESLTHTQRNFLPVCYILYTKKIKLTV